MLSSLISAFWPWSGCPCPADLTSTFMGFRLDDVRLLLWLLRDLSEIGLPIRIALGLLMLAAAKVILKTLRHFPERWQRQTAHVVVDWLMFFAGVSFCGPVWIVANIVHNCLYYNQFEAVWAWMLVVPVVAQGEGIILYLLPPGAPAPATMFEKCRQIVDLVWRMRQ